MEISKNINYGFEQIYKLAKKFYYFEISFSILFLLMISVFFSERSVMSIFEFAVLIMSILILILIIPIFSYISLCIFYKKIYHVEEYFSKKKCLSKMKKIYDENVKCNMGNIITCPSCGKRIIKDTKTKIFCSKKCKRRYANMKKD